MGVAVVVASTSNGNGGGGGVVVADGDPADICRGDDMDRLLLVPLDDEGDAARGGRGPSEEGLFPGFISGGFILSRDLALLRAADDFLAVAGEPSRGDDRRGELARFVCRPRSEDGCVTSSSFPSVSSLSFVGLVVIGDDWRRRMATYVDNSCNGRKKRLEHFFTGRDALCF